MGACPISPNGLPVQQQPACPQAALRLSAYIRGLVTYLMTREALGWMGIQRAAIKFAESNPSFPQRERGPGVSAGRLARWENPSARLLVLPSGLVHGPPRGSSTGEAHPVTSSSSNSLAVRRCRNPGCPRWESHSTLQRSVLEGLMEWVRGAAAAHTVGGDWPGLQPSRGGAARCDGGPSPVVTSLAVAPILTASVSNHDSEMLVKISGSSVWGCAGLR